MSDCGICLTTIETDSDDLWLDGEILTLESDVTCCECGKQIRAGDRAEKCEVFTYDERQNLVPSNDRDPVYSCLICSEIADAYYCDGRMWCQLWDDMNDVFDVFSVACLNRLSSVAAKTELQRRWMIWAGLQKER